MRPEPWRAGAAGGSDRELWLPLSPGQAADNRDALAKAVYGIVFNFIVSGALRESGAGVGE